MITIVTNTSEIPMKLVDLYGEYINTITVDEFIKQINDSNEIKINDGLYFNVNYLTLEIYKKLQSDSKYKDVIYYKQRSDKPKVSFMDKNDIDNITIFLGTEKAPLVSKRLLKQDTTITDQNIEKKYEMLIDPKYRKRERHYLPFSSSRKFPDRAVYPIRALRDFGDVKAGDIGGYIECEDNLSHKGNCWIYDATAVVSGDAQILDNAKIYSDTSIWGNTIIKDNVQILGPVDICGTGEIRISGNSIIHNNGSYPLEFVDNVVISGDTEIFGKSSGKFSNIEIIDNEIISKK